MTKVAIIHNVVAPYRIPLFEKLSQCPDLENVVVYYCLEQFDKKLCHTAFNSTKEMGLYKKKILPGFVFSLPLLNFPIALNVSIIKEILSNDFDVIVLCGFSDITTQLAFLLGKIKNIKLVLWTEMTGNFLNHGDVYTFITKLMINYFDAIIVPSTISKKFHSNLGYPQEKIFISPNCSVDEDYMKSASEYRANKIEIKRNLSIHNDKLILFVGRLVSIKGIENLISAFQKIKNDDKDVGLVIVGDGPLRSELESFCSLRDVYFQGQVEHKETIKYYSISDVFVLPSRFELHPLVITEAMAAGLPVITTTAAANAFDTIVDKKNGFIIEKENIEKLTSSIDFVLSHTDEMHKGAIESARNSLLPISVNAFLEAIKLIS